MRVVNQTSAAFLKNLLLFLALSLVFTSFNTETFTDKLDAQLKDYKKYNPSSSLYLHIDKNNYSPSDTIWFKAYVLSGEYIDNKVIYVRLVDDNNKIIVKRQFMMYDIRAHGELVIPSTVKEGSYSLYAYTDKMINFSDKDVFVQSLTIRRDAEKMLETEAFVTDTNKLARGGKVQVTIRIKQGINLLKNIKGNYQLLDGNTVIKSGKTVTNMFGEAFIDFVYPQLADDKMLKLKASFRREKEYAEVALNLRHEGNKLSINLYPEGGHLIDGLQSKTIVEVLDVNKNPVSAGLTLMNGNNSLAQIRTNKQGIAVLNFVPRLTGKYSFQTSYLGRHTIADFKYPILDKGYTLTITRSTEGIAAVIKNKGELNDALLIFRSADKIVFSKEIPVKPGDSLRVPIVSKNLPGNVLSAALFDQSGVLKAERIFLNKFEQEYHLAIKTDEKTYGQRKKVTISFDANDNDGSPLATNLSVAVVEKNSISSATYRNILHSYYYKAIEGNLSAFASSQSEADLDNLLITKSWTDSWQKVIKFVPSGPLRLLENTDGVVGFIIQTLKGKFDVKDVRLSSLKSPVRYSFPVGEDHVFSIPSSYLLIDDDDELFIKQSAEFNSAYQIVYYTPDRKFDKRVLAGEALFSPTIFDAFTNGKRSADKILMRKAVMLKQVKIGGESTPVQNFQTGDCTDFVCAMNILNCTGQHTANSPGSFSPVEGGRYRYHDAIITYYGCDDYRFKSISKPHQFYLPDYEKNASADPQEGTTIYWNPNTGTPKTGKNIISFFTSDLTGEFTVMAQGINVNTLKPVYGSTTFSVK